jgi:hypothetical protein
VVVPPFLKRIESTPEAGAASLAESLSVTVRLAVEAAPVFMDMVPFGTTVSTNQLRLGGVVSTFPALSMALTWKVWLPWLRLE